MKTVVDVTEVDRRSPEVRERSDRQREAFAAPRVIATSIDAALAEMEREARVYERGFEAGIRAANAAYRARGTRDFFPEDEPTAPYPIVEPGFEE